MRIANLSLLLLLLLTAACPRQDRDTAATAPADGTAEPDATATGAPAEPEPEPYPKGIVVFHDPALGEPMQAFAKQVFIVQAQELALRPAELPEITAIMQDPSRVQPQIVIFGYQPLLPKLAADGMIVETTARTFAGDRLVLAEKAGTGFETPTLFDTHKLRFNKLGYLSEETSLGKPSYQALVSDALLERIKDRTQTFASLRELFAALTDGTVELALLPASLAAQSTAIRPVLVVDEDLHEDIRYVAAATPGNETKPTVLEVLKLLAEDQTLQQLFVGYGLLNRETALVEN